VTLLSQLLVGIKIDKHTTIKDSDAPKAPHTSGDSGVVFESLGSRSTTAVAAGTTLSSELSLSFEDLSLRSETESLHNAKFTLERGEKSPAKSGQNSDVAMELRPAVPDRQTETQHVRLGGAARKRYKKLLEVGRPPGRATKLMALRPLGGTGAPSGTPGPKRTRSDDTTPPAQSSKKSKGEDDASTSSSAASPEGTLGRVAESGVIRTPPVADISTISMFHGENTVPTTSSGSVAKPEVTFRQVAESENIGILPMDYPDTILSVEQLNAVQEGIMEMVLKQKEKELKPKFLGSLFRFGWLMVTCGDKATAQWLREAIGVIKPWEGAQLQAVEASNLPRAQIVFGTFPGSAEMPSDRILDFIKSQNGGMQAAKWKVIRREPRGTSAFCTLSVDHVTVERLKQVDYKVNYRFGHVQLHPKGQVKPSAKAAKPHPKTQVKPVVKAGIQRAAGKGKTTINVPKTRLPSRKQKAKEPKARKKTNSSEVTTRETVQEMEGISQPDNPGPSSSTV